MAAFSFFSHFLADLCICFDVMRRLTSSSSSDTLFPILLVDWSVLDRSFLLLSRCVRRSPDWKFVIGLQSKCTADTQAFTWIYLRILYPASAPRRVRSCSWTARPSKFCLVRSRFAPRARRKKLGRYHSRLLHPGLIRKRYLERKTGVWVFSPHA